LQFDDDVTDLNQTSSDTLRHFSRQLHSWCSERLAQKPGPFRQAEICQGILGNTEPLSPPIVLWVNRDSFLAGGLLVLPRNKDEDIFATGRELARIYGLPCFFSWGRHELACWSTAYDPPEKTWEYELPQEDISSPAAFRKSLNLLIDRMEGSFYERQGEIPAVTLPYLLNLVHLTMKDLLPQMQKALQIEKATSEKSEISIGEIKNLLFRQLLLPVVLTAYDSPAMLSAGQSIIDGLNLAAEQLPAPLRDAFTKPVGLPGFPTTCHRRLVHFVNRVQQLKPHYAVAIEPLVTQLLAAWATDLGGHPLPESNDTRQRVVINPAVCMMHDSLMWEIGSIGILAATATIRLFAGHKTDSPPKQVLNPLELTNRLTNHLVLGTLKEQRLPPASEQKRLNALLRVSWPHQKLALAARTPVWVWEFMHLCGLCEGTSTIDITIPGHWLWERFGEKIAPVLLHHLSFSQVVPDTSESLRCQLKPRQDDPVTRVMTHDGKTRDLKKVSELFFRNQLLVALSAPDEIFNLMESGAVSFYTPEQCHDFHAEGTANYLHSSLGRNIWRLLAPGRPLPKIEIITQECARAGILLPEKKVISAMGKLSMKGKSPSIADLDQELAVWLGTTSPLPLDERMPKKALKVVASEDQTDQFLRNCMAEEVPTFPTDYNYHIPSSEQVRYEFVGPLTIIDSFFDQVVLQDQEKKLLTIHGTRQAEALVLFSSSSSGPLELPSSQHETAVILDRYRQDLKQLRQAYYRHAVTCLPETQTGKMVDDLWKRLSLPDWSLVKES